MTTKTDNKRFKTTLKPVTIANADEAQKPHLENSQKQMGMVPNMYKTW